MAVAAVGLGLQQRGGELLIAPFLLARAVGEQLAASLTQPVVVRDWTRQNRTWFAAVQVEKRMMFIILTLIIAVAAFYLVAMLAMVVTACLSIAGGLIAFLMIDSEVLELDRHPDLLCEIHRAAGRLFTIAQSGIEDADSVLWHGVPPVGKQERMLRRLGPRVKAIIFMER